VLLETIPLPPLLPLPVAFATAACTICPAELKTIFTSEPSAEYEYVFCVKPLPTLCEVPVLRARVSW